MADYLNPRKMSPVQRRAEIVRILSLAVRRLGDSGQTFSKAEKLSESSESLLDDSSETRLHVPVS